MMAGGATPDTLHRHRATLLLLLLVPRHRLARRSELYKSPVSLSTLEGLIGIPGKICTLTNWVGASRAAVTLPI